MQRDYRNVLGKDVLPAIGNIPAKAVTREMSEAAKAHTGVEFTPDVKAHMVESILTKMEDQNIYAFVDP